MAKEEHWDLGDRLRVYAPGVAGRVIGAGDGGRPVEARVFRRLSAQNAQVPGALTGLALLVKAIARTVAGKERGDDLPPEVGGCVEAHLLDPRVGQRVEPLVQARAGGPDGADQSLGG